MNIVVDVETVPLEPGKHMEKNEHGIEEDKGALSPITGRIVAIGARALKDNVIFIDKDEKKILTDFWDYINRVSNETTYPKFVGFNFNFDIHFLIVRSLHHNIKVNKILKTRCIDLRGVLTNYNFYIKGKLSDYASLIGLNDKCDGMTGANIQEKWGKRGFRLNKKVS